MSRWLRCLICLALICCILVNCSPLRAEATGAGVAAATITGAATVTVSAPIAIGAAVIALGIAAGTNDDFQRLVDTAVSAAGDWVKDGTVELLQTINSAGEKAYYVAGEMMDDLRSWVYDASVVSPAINSFDSSNQYSGYLSALADYCSSFGCSSAYVCFINKSSIKDTLCFAQFPFTFCDDGYLRSYSGSDATDIKIYQSSSIGSSSFVAKAGVSLQLADERDFFDYYFFSSASPAISALDVTLGYLPSQTTDLTDGTSARDWSEAMTNNGLYVTGGSNDPDPPDENNGKWFWPLALPLTLGVLGAMSQADEWSGKTPQEFDDYSKQTEFEILSRPEVEFGQGIEIAPVTSPSPDPGTGTDPDPGTDPTAPGEPNPDPEPDPEPNPDPDPDPNPDPGTDPGTGNVGDAWQPSEMTDFTLDLKDYFPFCIPFDLYDFYTCLNADPVVPVIEWVIPLPGGETYPLELDLSPFDPVAQLLRRLQLLLFCVGLAFKTRDLIKG